MQLLAHVPPPQAHAFCLTMITNNGAQETPTLVSVTTQIVAYLVIKKDYGLAWGSWDLAKYFNLSFILEFMLFQSSS